LFDRKQIMVKSSMSEFKAESVADGPVGSEEVLVPRTVRRLG
jgi:hypothetical protein